MVADAHLEANTTLLGVLVEALLRRLICVHGRLPEGGFETVSRVRLGRKRMLERHGLRLWHITSGKGAVEGVLLRGRPIERGKVCGEGGWHSRGRGGAGEAAVDSRPGRDDPLIKNLLGGGIGVATIGVKGALSLLHVALEDGGEVGCGSAGHRPRPASRRRRGGRVRGAGRAACGRRWRCGHLNGYVLQRGAAAVWAGAIVLVALPMNRGRSSQPVGIVAAALPAEEALARQWWPSHGGWPIRPAAKAALRACARVLAPRGGAIGPRRGRVLAARAAPPPTAAADAAPDQAGDEQDEQ
mmetsp:Transcript_30459/g.93080  ORF Transcript_30459/g.93080 Transcript_30459/m.93080 type:complete len:299 (-) Transcript_30459:144-1040(-)